MSAQNFYTQFREDATATVFGRVSSAGSTGSATGVAGEGNWTLRADLSSITYRVWDDTNNEEITSGATSVTITDVIVDTPVTSTANWPIDTTGYNFTHNLPSTSFPNGGANCRVEYTFNYSANSVVGKGVLYGPVKSLSAT